MWIRFEEEVGALANRCIRHGKEDTSDHILIHCEPTRVVWDFVFSLFGVFSVLPFFFFFSRIAFLAFLGCFSVIVYFLYMFGPILVLLFVNTLSLVTKKKRKLAVDFLIYLDWNAK